MTVWIFMSEWIPHMYEIKLDFLLFICLLSVWFLVQQTKRQKDPPQQFVANLRTKAFNLPSSNMMLAVGFSWVLFIK